MVLFVDLKKGIVFLSLVISLAFVPPLMAVGDTYTLKIWTEKTTYHVGEYWHGIFWDTNGPCLQRGRSRSGTLTIKGPSTSMLVNVPTDDLRTTGNYLPSFGKPWTAADVGNWTSQIEVKASSDQCLASGTAQFRVIT
jgi:hypothetical protein